MAQKITPRSEDYSAWYIDIVCEAKLADYSPVRGFMVIRPRGYALWEKIQLVLDNMFKETGHQNAYFPSLIPQSFLEKEAEHIEGFSPELAVVTHAGGDKLDEPLIIRPTSETIIWNMYSKWIKSHRDLPLKINQWANVIRWEKRTRLFLRTSEFLWQEGHTAHETEAEAQEETLTMIEIYRQFLEDFLAIPVYVGIKTEKEKFAGAVETYCVEAMMQDKKALQAGTSHNLGQNFSKAFNVKYQDREGNWKYVWATSWGVSTRLIGALIMTHSDDKGLMIPPRIAPTQVVCICIFNKNTKDQVIPYAQEVFQNIRTKGIRVEIDYDEKNSVGWRFSEWELLGVPLRIEIGPQDALKQQVVLVRRDTNDKKIVSLSHLISEIEQLLEQIQKDLFQKAINFRSHHTYNDLKTYNDLRDIYEKGSGGFVLGDWCSKSSCEDKLKDELKVTIRCMPVGYETLENSVCLICGAAAQKKVLLARSY